MLGACELYGNMLNSRVDWWGKGGMAVPFSSPLLLWNMAELMGKHFKSIRVHVTLWGCCYSQCVLIMCTNAHNGISHSEWLQRVWIMFTIVVYYTVYWYYALIQCINMWAHTVYSHYVLIMYTNSVYYTVHWYCAFCVRILCTDIMNSYCVLTLCTHNV